MAGSTAITAEKARAARLAASDAKAAVVASAVAAGKASAAAAAVAKACADAAALGVVSELARAAELASIAAAELGVAAEKASADAAHKASAAAAWADKARQDALVVPSVDKEKMDLKKCMEVAVDQLNWVSMELRGCAGRLNKDEEYVEGCQMTQMAHTMESLAEITEYTAFECQDNLNSISNPRGGEEEEDQELWEEIWTLEDNGDEPPGPSMAEWCEENDIDIDDLLDHDM